MQCTLQWFSSVNSQAIQAIFSTEKQAFLGYDMAVVVADQMGVVEN